MQYSFSAQELLCMAYFADYEYICGIPDIFSVVPEEEAVRLFDETAEKLLSDGVLEMDFDGEVSLCEPYWEVMQMCCACDRCLTVNRQFGEDSGQTQIFWILDGVCWMAEACNQKYLFSVADFPMMTADIGWNSENLIAVPEMTIVDAFLFKAKRQLLEGNEENCQRTLYQNGASKELAAVLMDGYKNQAEFLELSLFTFEEDELVEITVSFLGGHGISLEMIPKQEGFRDCTAFIPRDNKEINDGIRRLCALFLGK